MRRFLKASLVLALCLACVPFRAEAVSFGSSGGKAAPVKTSGSSQSSRNSKQKGIIAQIDLPKGQKLRLAESVELLRLTGLQATLATRRLVALNKRDASTEEMKAHLENAMKCWEVAGKAGDRLVQTVSAVRAAWDGGGGKEEFFAAAEEILEVFPSLRSLFEASPALAYGPTPDEMMEYELQMVGRELQKDFGKAMEALSSAGRAAKNAASAVGNGLMSALGYLTSPIRSAHHKIGNAVGQKNWALIMAGTKFGAAVTSAGIGLVVVFSAPVSTPAALGAVAIYAVANVGACVSFINDAAEIEGKSHLNAADDAMKKISQGTAIIGLAGKPQEVVVSVLEATGDEIANAPGNTQVPDNELEGYLDQKDLEAFLKTHGSLVASSTVPVGQTASGTSSISQSGSGDAGAGGGGGGGGCSDGCGN